MDTSKIIIGTVGGGKYTVTAPIVKEDYGLYLQIEGIELPETYEVDFSNDEHSGSSVTMIGNSDGVLIPSQFIKSGKDVFAFLYHVGDNYGRTVFKFRIPNKLRPDRTNEQPTPEEQSVIDQAISALNSAVAQTAQDVIDASASAQSASESTEQAQESARTAGLYSDTAQTYANSAEISANSASASATASAQSASQSAQIKSDVEGMVDDAQASASASAQSASASANSASQASGYAQSASASAQSASGYASQAQTSAQTASSKASEASTSASTASTQASEALSSALSASGYATQAESAKTASQTAQGLAESARDSAISAQESAEDARDEAQSIVDGISEKVEQIDANTADIASLEEDRYKPYAVDSASGAIASFVDGADDIPLKSLVVDINPVQDLHGQNAPYPAGGGKNLFNIDNIPSTGSNVTNNGDGSITVKASAGSSGMAVKDKTFAELVPGLTVGETYYINAVSTGTLKYVYCSTMWKFGEALKLTQAIYDSKLYFYASGTSTTAIIKDIIICKNSESDKSFAPYENICPISGWTQVDVNHSDADMTNPTTLTIQLGQTVYGGKLDVLSGELTVYPYYASYNGETLTGRWISDRDAYVAGTTPTIGAQVVDMSGTGTEVQLEANEIASLLGANNLWADTGDVAVEYRADTKLYIERLTAPDSADMIADANITSGQYFMVGNNLYKATANIANGGQIVVGTNCTRVSLAQALNEINA